MGNYRAVRITFLRKPIWFRHHTGGVEDLVCMRTCTHLISYLNRNYSCTSEIWEVVELFANTAYVTSCFCSCGRVFALSTLELWGNIACYCSELTETECFSQFYPIIYCASSLPTSKLLYLKGLLAVGSTVS